MKYSVAIIPALIALLALTGWEFDIEMLKRFDSRMVAMNPATAVSFMLLSASVLIAYRRPANARLRALAIACAAIVMSVGAFKLLQIWLGLGPGPDTWLFVEKLAREPGRLNRMAPNTAANFVLLGAATVLLHLGRRVALAQAVAIATALIAMLAIVGYAYGIGSFYGVGSFIPMAVHTATSFLLAAGAVLYMHPHAGLMATVTNDGPAGRTARILLPCAIVIPIGMGWLRLLGQRAGLYESELGVSMFVMSNVFAFALLIWWNARQLHAADLLRHEAERNLMHAATHDFLTGLANRKLFMQRLEYRLQMAHRHPSLPFAVLYLDLDGFKQVNDRLGHQRGDTLLCEVASDLLACSRNTDLVARLGGDEFTILAELVNHEDDVRHLADRVLAKLARSLACDNDVLKVHTSIGIALYRPGYDSPDAILHDADTALYAAKTGGKGRYVHFSPELAAA
jgi:diguanylate cyclase (GGDEF)-like protein